MLFVPGNDARKVAKALDSDADCIILDLEDAVALAEKDSARREVEQIVRNRGDRQVYVRVNSMDTPYLYEDLTTIIQLYQLVSCCRKLNRQFRSTVSIGL